MTKPTSAKNLKKSSQDSLIKELSEKNKKLEEAVRDLTLLNDIAVRSGKLQDVNKILDMILERAILHLDAEQGSILLLTAKDSNDLKTLLRQNDRRSRMFSTKLGSNITGWVLHHKKPLRIDDLANDSRFISHEKGTGEIRSALCTPIFYKGAILGILMVVNKKNENNFTDSDLRLLGILANQSGQIIRNVQLQEEALKNEREKNIQLKLLNDAYSRFVPSDFLKFLGKDSILDVSLGDGVELETTVFISDIRSFTTISENMTPEENFKFINDYLSIASPVIKEYGGIINRFSGDSLMALFPNRPNDAILAAVETQRELAKINKSNLKKRKNILKVGIGIHLGKLMLGIIGDNQRNQGDVFSDTVNTTNRIEQACKLYSASVLVSEDVIKKLVIDDSLHIRSLGRIQMKGKRDYIVIYEILNGEEERVGELKMKTKTSFEEGMDNYYSKNFPSASVHFKKVIDQNPEDKAAQFYLQRSAEYMIQGVPVNWEGVESS